MYHKEVPAFDTPTHYSNPRTVQDVEANRTLPFGYSVIPTCIVNFHYVFRFDCGIVLTQLHGWVT